MDSKGSKGTKSKKFPRTVKGTVKQIQSGDYIILSKKNKNGNTQEFHFYLASISAPKVGTPQREEEPFAYKAKEWLMDRVVGCKAEFVVEYEINSRECGTLMVKDKNVNVEIARTGYVKLNEKKKEDSAASKHYAEIASAIEEAKRKRLGLYNEDADHTEYVRELTYSNNKDFDVDEVFDRARKSKKPYKARVEYVFSPNAVNVYIETLSIVTRINMVHIYTPQQERQISIQAKEMVEKLILNRTVGVEILRIDNYGTLVGRIHHPQGDIALELVKKGLSKILVPEGDDYDKEYYRQLKDAQDVASIKQNGLWKVNKDEESKKKTKGYDSKKKNFEARVVEVHSGDSLTVIPEGSSEGRRLFLASIKAPAMARRDSDDNEPWAWESKEFVRKQAIGKKVKVEMEFQREIEIKHGDQKGNKKIMEFATIFVGKTNLAQAILEKGFARTALSKFKEENSKYFEELIAADTKAAGKKAGLHSTKEAKIYRFIDTSKNSKAARTIYTTLTSKPSIKGVIEYCFSGQKYKIRLDSENCSVAFGLIGVKIPQPDPNQPGITEISNNAKEYAKNALHQRDVVINVKYMDKRGTFLGNLWFWNEKGRKKGEHFGTHILRKGYGSIQEDNSDKLDDYEVLEEEEKKAAEQEVGVWKPQISAVIGLASGEQYDEITEDTLPGKIVDMQDATTFYVNFNKDEEKLKEISEKLKEYDDDKYDNLVHPIKAGTICAALFETDGNWYRGRVERSVHAGDDHLYEVYFMDFGNRNDIPAINLKKIDNDLIQYPPLAHRCTLAYINVPKGDKTFGSDAADLFKEQLWGKTCTINICDEDDVQFHVCVCSGKDLKPNESINAYLLSEGLASLTHSDSLPEDFSEWKDFEQDAKDDQLNIWEIGGGDIATE